jgi:hypothetical protein
VKVLVLAVIVGIGSTIFSQFQSPSSTDPSLNHALALMLASLTLLGLGIFGPGIATGLVSGAPQLGAGAAAGTALGVGGLAVAGVQPSPRAERLSRPALAWPHAALSALCGLAAAPLQRIAPEPPPRRAAVHEPSARVLRTSCAVACRPRAKEWQPAHPP